MSRHGDVSIGELYDGMMGQFFVFERRIELVVGRSPRNWGLFFVELSSICRFQVRRTQLDAVSSNTPCQDCIPMRKSWKMPKRYVILWKVSRRDCPEWWVQVVALLSLQSVGIWMVLGDEFVNLRTNGFSSYSSNFRIWLSSQNIRRWWVDRLSLTAFETFASMHHIFSSIFFSSFPLRWT